MGESHVAVSFLKVASVTCHYYSLIIIGLCILPLFVMLLRRGGRGFPRSTFLPVFYLSYTVLGQNYFPYIVLPIPDVLRSWLVLFYVPRSHTLLFSVLSYLFYVLCSWQKIFCVHRSQTPHGFYFTFFVLSDIYFTFSVLGQNYFAYIVLRHPPAPPL